MYSTLTEVQHTYRGTVHNNRGTEHTYRGTVQNYRGTVHTYRGTIFYLLSIIYYLISNIYYLLSTIYSRSVENLLDVTSLLSSLKLKTRSRQRIVPTTSNKPKVPI